jgi:hypothetical protein
MLRLIFPGPLEPTWLNWNDRTVRRIARKIRETVWAYRGVLPEGFCLLHDALIDAGCEDREILEHCRTPCPHRENCSVLHLLLAEPAAE